MLRKESQKNPQESRSETSLPDVCQVQLNASPPSIVSIDFSLSRYNDAAYMKMLNPNFNPINPINPINPVVNRLIAEKRLKSLDDDSSNLTPQLTPPSHPLSQPPTYHPVRRDLHLIK